MKREPLKHEEEGKSYQKLLATQTKERERLSKAQTKERANAAQMLLLKQRAEREALNEQQARERALFRAKAQMRMRRVASYERFSLYRYPASDHGSWFTVAVIVATGTTNRIFRMGWNRDQQKLSQVKAAQVLKKTYPEVYGWAVVQCKGLSHNW